MKNCILLVSPNMRYSDGDTAGLDHDCGAGAARLEFLVRPDADMVPRIPSMSRRSKRPGRGSGRVIVIVLALSAMLLPISFAQDLPRSEKLSLHGTVRDPQGKAAANALLELRSESLNQTFTTRTDSQGAYRFSSMKEGRYSLRVTMSGYEDSEIHSLVFADGDDKTIDLMLRARDTTQASTSTQDAPRFFDQPQFTVSGVTDTTNLGGHGSDTVTRTRETLAKETVALAKPSTTARGGVAATETSLRKELDHDPQGFDANHQLGRLLVENDRAGEAITFLQRAAEIKPADYDNAYDLALANEQSGNYQIAREQIHTLMGVRDAAELHHLLAEVQEKLGDPLEAAREYEHAATENPSEAFLFDWASELLLHHAPEPALQVFSKGNALYPRSSRMLIGMGAALFAHGSNEQAFRRICDASDIEPNNAIPYRFLGKMQRVESAPPGEVAERLHRYLSLQPQTPEANYFYAVALWKLRKHGQDSTRSSQVISLLTNTIHLDPDYAPAHLQLGIVYAELKDYAAAISSLQRAVKTDPQTEEAHYRLGQAYRQTGQTEKAKDELGIYEELSKENARRVERERHEIRQFVYTLRDPLAPRAE